MQDSTSVSNFSIETIVSEEFIALSIRVAMLIAIGLPVVFMLRGGRVPFSPSDMPLTMACWLVRLCFTPA
ncbi:MAG: hypothetical protein U5K69_12170 [Balneolaceae bacterium]|nr:hypothetical protein [Balneolaceae bacterium]